MIKEDLEQFDLDHYDDEDIKAMKKEKWKIIVKEAMQFKALQDLKSQI